MIRPRLRFAGSLLHGALFLALLALMLLAGCAAPEKRDPQALYDLGTPSRTSPLVASTSPLPVIVVPDMLAPSWMDTSRMFYRLRYDNPNEARTYASARWTIAPSRLLQQRIRSGLASGGYAVLTSVDATPAQLLLRLEAEDFSQEFTAVRDSQARVAIRASLLESRRLLAQKTFYAQAPAPSPDAPGGVIALSVASDAIIGDLLQWLSTVPRNR